MLGKSLKQIQQLENAQSSLQGGGRSRPERSYLNPDGSLRPPRDFRRPPTLLSDHPGFNVDNLVNEAIDPTDCRRWSDSPYCGGGMPVEPIGLNPLRPLQSSLFPTGFGLADYGSSHCVTWVGIAPRLFGVSTPPIYFSYRQAGCTEPWERRPPRPGNFPTNTAPPPQPNPFTEGWSPGCRYFVLLKLRPSPYLQDNSQPWAAATQSWYRQWDRYGNLQALDLVIPAYGPIESIEHELAYTSNIGGTITNVYQVSLKCGGLGQYPLVDYRGRVLPINPFYRQSISALTGLTRETNWIFTYPGISRPHHELFPVLAGADLDPITGSPIGRQGTFRCPIIQYPHMSFEFYDIIPAWQIQGWRYQDGFRPSYGAVCAPVPPPPPRPHGDPPMTCCSCEEISRLIDRKLRPIYAILGFPQGRDAPTIEFNPSEDVPALMEEMFPQGKDPKAVTVPNLQTMMNALFGYLMHQGLDGETIGKIYKVLGGDDWFNDKGQPEVELPELLLAYKEDKTVKEKSFLQLFLWWVKQFDAVVGQFPIKIHIKDADPETSGNQTKDLELPNIAEALAELYGLAQFCTTSADIEVNFLTRLAAETIATKNSSLITQDHVKAISSYLGYRGNPVQRKIKYAFDIHNATQLDKLLQEAEGSLTGWQEEDKNTVAEYLQRLMFAAGIIKAVFFKSAAEMEALKDKIEELGQNPEDNQAWEAFKDMINTPDSRFNQPTDEPADSPYPQPKIKDIATNAAQSPRQSTPQPSDSLQRNEGNQGQ